MGNVDDDDYHGPGDRKPYIVFSILLILTAAIIGTKSPLFTLILTPGLIIFIISVSEQRFRNNIKRLKKESNYITPDKLKEGMYVRRLSDGSRLKIFEVEIAPNCVKVFYRNTIRGYKRMDYFHPNEKLEVMST